VVKGELSLQQAADMMELLHENAGDDDGADDEDFRAEMKEELEEVGAELRAAVMRGEMSEKEAWGAWYAFKKKEFAPQLKEAVRDGVLSEKEAWMWWIGVKKAEHAQRLKDAVMKGEMSEEDARKKWMQMENGHHKHHRDGHPHHKQHGKHGHHSDRKGHWGHGDKHHGDKHHGDKHHGDKHHGDKHHGDKPGADARDRMPGGGEVAQRIRGALEEADFTPEQMRMARGVIMRMAYAMQSGGDDYEMNPRMQSFLTEKAEFNEEQITLLEGIAKRVSMRMPEGQHRGPHNQRADMRKMREKMKERIEGAVERGDMTREEADAKYREIRERMDRRQRAKQDGEDSRAAGEDVAEEPTAQTNASPPITEPQSTTEAIEAAVETKSPKSEPKEPQATESA